MKENKNLLKTARYLSPLSWDSLAVLWLIARYLGLRACASLVVLWFIAKLKNQKENKGFLWLNLVLNLFIAVIIGGLEICILSTMHIVILIALICLMIINFELFFKKEKYRYRREITNINTNLNNLTRKNTILPWFISTVILIVIFTIISCIFGLLRPIYLNINWESIVVYLINEPLFYVIIFVVLIQINLVMFSLNWRRCSLKEICFLLGYIFTLRLGLLLLLNIIFFNDQGEIILSISVYDILSEKGILEGIMAWLQPKDITTVLDGLRIKKYINQLVNIFLEKYKPLYFNRIIPFEYRLLSEPSYSKVSLVKPKLLGSGYYRSQFQPYTLPQVYDCPPFNVLIYNMIFSSPTLTDVYINYYINLINKDYSDISSWDNQSTVGSSWEGETIIGSEIDRDLDVCDNKVKLKDPQLNFSSEYFYETRIQSVFVNKGNKRAISLDLTSDNEENSHNIVEDTDLNQVANFLDEEDVNRAINESHQTHRYNLRSRESSGRGLYGQGNTTTSVTGLAPLEAQPTILEDESMVYQQIDLDNNQYISQEYTNQIPEGEVLDYPNQIPEGEVLDYPNQIPEGEVLDYPLWGIDGSLHKEKESVVNLNESAQIVQDFRNAQLDNEDTSSTLSHNSVESEDIWTSDFTKEQCRIYFDSIAHEELFSYELYEEFTKNWGSLGEISSSIINDNVEWNSENGMYDLSLEGLVSLSENIIPKLNQQFSIDKVVNSNCSSETNIITESSESLYSLTKSKLQLVKSNFNQSLKYKKILNLSAKKKEELISEFNAKYEKYQIAIEEKKNSNKDLENLQVKFKTLYKDLFETYTGEAYTRYNGNDESIKNQINTLRKYIYTLRKRSTRLIKNSNLDQKYKDVLLSQVYQIVSNLRKGINANKMDKTYFDALEKNFQDIRDKVTIQCEFLLRKKFSIVFMHQYNKSYCFYPKSKISFLISQIHRDIRKEIIDWVSLNIQGRIKTAEIHKIIHNKQTVYDELKSDIDLLKKDLFMLSNLQDVCKNLVERLIILNIKYQYSVSRESGIYSNNNLIYVKLKAILENYIEIYKQNK